MHEKIRTYIILLVSTIWAISFVADIAMKEYDPSPFVHLAMMAVVGATVGDKLFNKSKEEG